MGNNSSIPVDQVVAPADSKRKALLIGIDYLNTPYQLAGSINDVDKVRQILIQRYGFLPQNITVLTDQTNIKPTRSNILNALNQLAQSTQAGDLIYVHYSGHGIQVAATGDAGESDGKDEVIIPLDFKTAGYIRDDELRNHLIDQLPSGSQARIFIDACNATTMFDLRYTVDRPDHVITHNYPETSADVIVLSAARDDQLAYESNYPDRKQGGIFTVTYLRLLNSLGANVQIGDLYSNIQSNFKSLTQNPQVSFGKAVNLNANWL